MNRSDFPLRPCSIEIHPAENGCVIYVNHGPGYVSEMWVEHAPSDIGRLVGELSEKLMAANQKS